jgi:hypothetical protein
VRRASAPKSIESFAVFAADTATVVGVAATRTDSVSLRGLWRGVRAFVATDFGFALGFGFGLVVTALSVASGCVGDAGGVDSIEGSGAGAGGGAGAVVRVGRCVESPADGCGSGVGDTRVVVVGL